MRDDRFDVEIIGVGCGFGARENIFVVEDVETLVLHRAHIEIRHRDDVENVEIVFAAKGFLVPAHRPDQGVQRVTGAVFLAPLDINAQIDFST